MLVFFTYLDRSNLSFAAFQFKKDIHLSNTVYGLGASESQRLLICSEVGNLHELFVSDLFWVQHSFVEKFMFLKKILRVNWLPVQASSLWGTLLARCPRTCASRPLGLHG